MRVPAEQFIFESDFREEREGIGDLALSIKNVGLLQPILVEKVGDSYIVRAGRSRFIALTEYLGLTHLEEGKHFILREGIDDLVAQLEENIQRSDLKPVEIARLVKAIHERGVEEKGRPVPGHTGGWTVKDTAKLLGKDPAMVSRLLKIADNEELVRDATSVSEAVRKMDAEEKKKILGAVEKAKAAKAKVDFEGLLANYRLGDAVSFLSTLDDASVDLVLTDPPYGINLDDVVASPEEAYEDEQADIVALLKACMPHFRRVLRDGRYMVLWTSYQLYEAVCVMAERAGFYVPRVPLIWVKSGATGRSIQSTLRVGCAAEIALYAYTTPDARLTKQGRSNIFTYPPPPAGKRFHAAQKPEALIIDIIQTFSSPGDTVLDVFCGSGSTIRACYDTNRQFIGCEKLERHYNKSISATIAYIEEKKCA